MRSAHEQRGFAFAGTVALAGFVAAVGAVTGSGQEPPAEWTYAGATGPSNWGRLSPDYAACADGRKQSPIDVRKAMARPLRNITFRYRAVTAARVFDTGHSMEWEFPAGSTIRVAGLSYALKQMHFHSPSEHRVGGRSWPLEIHVVHQTASGALAVVGMLVARGRHNESWAPLVRALRASGARELNGVRLRKLLPRDGRAFRYSGSLTTPPCSEGVHWALIKTPVAMSAKQIAAFQRRYRGNHRPIQPLNGRRVILDSDAK